MQPKQEGLDEKTEMRSAIQQTCDRQYPSI
jgi:hypothetical protein